MTAITAYALSFACVVALGCNGVVAAQQAAAHSAAAGENTGASGESQARARAILTAMARHLAATQQFSVRILGAYDAVQASGEKVEFAETRRLTVRRPDRMRLELQRSDGSQVNLMFTGQQIAVIDAGNNVYALSRQPGGLDSAIVHYVSDLGMPLPLAVLLLSTLPAELDSRVRSIDYVERTTAYGAPAHHLAARTASVDLQIWVTDGKLPLLQRVVVTYRDTAGQPQYRALFSDWNLAVASSDATFAAAAPEGARLIPFAAHLAGFVPGSRAVEPKGGSR